MQQNKSKIFIGITATSILIIIVLARLCFFNNTVDTPPRDYPEIVQSSCIKVATDYSPISYYIENDTITGFDYELLQMISRRANIKIDIEPQVSQAKSLELLDKRTYDIIARQIPVTSETQQRYIFTKPLQLNKQVLIQRIDSNGNVAIRNQLDLAGCTLNITGNISTRMRIDNLSQEIGDTIYIYENPEYGAEQLIILVATGEIDYAVCDETQAQIIASGYNNIDYKTDISFTQFMSWTLRQESQILRDSLDVWLNDIQQTAEYKALYTKYFGENKYSIHNRMNRQ